MFFIGLAVGIVMAVLSEFRRHVFSLLLQKLKTPKKKHSMIILKIIR